jgi:UDP-GlcNAc:undecaprenyl-phosphate GlcNAc-1-phosphate transferase
LTQLAVFLAAFLVVLLLTPLVGRWATAHGFYYDRRAQDIHSKVVPRLGGIPIFVAFVLAVGIAWVAPVPRPDAQEPLRVVGVLLGGAIIVAMGIRDDRRPLPPLPQFAGQVLAALTALAFGVRSDFIANPFGGALDFPMLAAIAFTLFWILGATNTVNWLDGLDGLAAGVTAIAALVLALHSSRLDQQSIALLALALAGAALGFLPHNFHPARIFLGGGAYLLGYLLGTLSIIGGTKGATLLLVLGIPILDTAWQIIGRIRRGRSPVHAERKHLHHRLFDLGLSQPRVVALYYAVSITFGALAIGLPSGLEKLVALGGLVLFLVVIIIALDRLPRRSGGG